MAVFQRILERCAMSLANRTAPSSSTKNSHSGIPSLSSRPNEVRQHRKQRLVRLTVSLPGDLVDRLRDAVYWSPSMTLAWLIARSLRTSLTEMESSRQGPFPKRTNALRAGRPRLVGQTMNLSYRAGLSGVGMPSMTEGSQPIE